MWPKTAHDGEWSYEQSHGPRRFLNGRRAWSGGGQMAQSIPSERAGRREIGMEGLVGAIYARWVQPEADAPWLDANRSRFRALTSFPAGRDRRAWRDRQIRAVEQSRRDSTAGKRGRVKFLCNFFAAVRSALGHQRRRVPAAHETMMVLATINDRPSRRRWHSLGRDARRTGTCWVNRPQRAWIIAVCMNCCADPSPRRHRP
jgi:hypothetical protein